MRFSAYIQELRFGLIIYILVIDATAKEKINFLFEIVFFVIISIIKEMFLAESINSVWRFRLFHRIRISVSLKHNKDIVHIAHLNQRRCIDKTAQL